MKNIFLTLSMIAVFALLFACKKEEAAPKTSKELLSANIWKVSKTDFKLTLANGLIPVPDSLNQNPLEAFVGGTFEFKTDGKVLITPTTGTPITNVTWELIENNTKLKLKGLIDLGSGMDLPISPEDLAQLEVYTILQLTATNYDMQNSSKFKLKVSSFPIPIDVEAKSSLYMIPK